MTDAELLELCREYQGLLRMRDWVISVHLCSGEELADAVGHSSFNSTARHAHIRIIREEDFEKTASVIEYDAEQILVHELQHCNFSSVDKADDVAFEQAIDSTADAIISLRRQLRRGETGDMIGNQATIPRS